MTTKTLSVPVLTGVLKTRFLSHFRQPMFGCWEWTGGHTNPAHAGSKGYGCFKIPDGIGKQRNYKAHRLAYVLFVGPIPDGFDIDHVRDNGCRSTLCVRPDHLEPVTRQVNLLRGNGFVAKNAATTHCPQGHPYSGENLRLNPEGKNQRAGRRFCKACERARRKRRYHDLIARGYSRKEAANLR